MEPTTRKFAWLSHTLSILKLVTPSVAALNRFPKNRQCPKWSQQYDPTYYASKQRSGKWTRCAFSVNPGALHNRWNYRVGSKDKRLETGPQESEGSSWKRYLANKQPQKYCQLYSCIAILEQRSLSVVSNGRLILMVQAYVRICMTISILSERKLTK